MKSLYTHLTTFFNSVRSKIAFYPTLLALMGFALAFIMIPIEQSGGSNNLLEIAPQLVLEDGDTALTVMSACIGGLISMMVFSFSMVMLLLSQASSNFSPRLLPGLISDRTHQIILGTYLATILYCIFTLFSIEPTDEKYSLPGLSILIGIILTILCICMFIYFIHNISQSIQINNILENIYEKSCDRLEIILKKEKEKEAILKNGFPDSDNWHTYTSKVTGYFQNISFENVTKIAVEKDFKIHILLPKGFFVLQHVPFFKTDKEIDEETLDEILSSINFSRGELVSDNYILAFKQITEIAVKAMSPGVNDPGTAINAIDYLTELFSLRIKKEDHGILVRDDKAVLKISIVAFKDLLYNCMASLRTYCKHDPIIVQKLLYMLQYIYNQEECKEEKYKEYIKKELDILTSEAKENLGTTYDFEQLKL